MTHCKTCKTKTQKNWNYCPQCGQKTKKDKYEIPIDKTKYLLDRQKEGELIYENFKTATQIGRFHKKKQETIREKLGDFININFCEMRIFSLLHQKPDYMGELFKIGRLLGYFASIEGAKQMNKEEYIGLPYNSDAFWELLSSKEFQESNTREWYLTKEGLLEFIKADKKRGTLVYHLKESSTSMLKSTKPLCFFELSGLCGISEAFSNAFWTGKETKCECKGDDHCEFELILEKGYTEPKLQKLNKQEVEGLINQCIDNMISRKKIKRNKLGDHIHIMDEQVINYLLISPSTGHNILAKYSGCLIGEKINKMLNITNQDRVMDHLATLLESMKVALLKVESKKEDMIKLRMDESVYSSGVKNINMKLDTFIAGVIEGALKQATNQKWLVEESKCLANGDEHCEFVCKVR